MFRKQIIDTNTETFSAVREGITSGVFGLPLIPSLVTGIKVTLTRIEAHGEFSSHKDSYHHVLYFISGNGIGWLDDEQYHITPGKLVHVPQGTLHGYRNDSDETLVLLTINIPDGEL